jgi:hypothetical protein
MRAQTEHIWLEYTRANRRSCHKGADIANDKQQLMAVVQKGKLTPWGTDYAKLTSATT